MRERSVRALPYQPASVCCVDLRSRRPELLRVIWLRSHRRVESQKVSALLLLVNGVVGFPGIFYMVHLYISGAVARQGRPGTERSRGKGRLRSPHSHLTHRDPLQGELVTMTTLATSADARYIRVESHPPVYIALFASRRTTPSCL